MPTDGPLVSLVIVTESDTDLVVRSDEGRVGCLQVRLSRGAREATLGELVEAAASRHLNVKLRYLGLLTSREVRGEQELVALATLHAPLGESVRSALGVRHMTLDEIRRATPPVEHQELFEEARQWCLVEQGAARLGPEIENAFAHALDFLDRHVSLEDGVHGWSQYLDGQTVGSLSTAQGVLAHLHASAPATTFDEMVSTIEAVQNPDGGWQVRRALVGRPSEISITESTCFCLWALAEAGRARTSPPVQRGIAWLEQTQLPDGGWRSSARSRDAQVSATAAAVRVLARFARHDPAARGVTWLRAAQCADGGWAATAGQHDGAPGSQPAHTAHAVIALAAARTAPADPAVRRGCEYLRSAFEPARPEPWRSTSVNLMVDDQTGARLDFRHFATPWALAALCLAGHDVGDPVVFAGTRRLLRLQDADGAWRSSLTAPGTPAIWAVSDAVFALRAVLDSSARNLAPVAMARHWEDERALLRRAVLRLLPGGPGPTWPAPAPPGRAHSLWLSAITVVVVLLGASQTGLLGALASSSPVSRGLAAGATALIAAGGALAPPLIAEEYRILRERRGRRSPEHGPR